MRWTIVAILAMAGTAAADIKMANPKVTSVDGKVDPLIVKRYLRRDQAKYNYCYEKQLLKDPTLRGTLTVAFRIQLDGRVTAVRVEGIDNEVENCVAGFVRRLQLPKLPEEATVRTKVMMTPPKPNPACRGGMGCGRLGGRGL